ncbi:MAG: phytanoyl-CoA dioxygenase family protein [Cyanobacteria bacterium P01_G01_bin.39]
MELSTDLSRFKDCGFCYVPSFLSPTEVELLRQDFEAASTLDNRNYHIRRVSNRAFDKISLKLKHLAELLSEQTDLAVDQLSRGVYFPNWKEGKTLVNLQHEQQKFPWHQDHESYFTLQNFSNYLNFYIPIIKPVEEQSNLSIIPLDQLATYAPKVSQKIIHRGATRIVSSPQGDIILDDDRGGIIASLDFPITDIEQTPHLKAGDLLLLRGDVFHRTQDASTRRVAASFRMFNGDTTVNRSQLARGGVVKTLMMLSNWKAYEIRFRYFDQMQTPTATAKSIRQYFETADLPPNSRRFNFLLRLLRERLLAGNLLEGLMDLRFLSLILKGVLS